MGALLFNDGDATPRNPSISPAAARPACEHALAFVVTSPEHVPQLVASGRFVPWRVGTRRALYASRSSPPNLDSSDEPTS
jgi:hypothetical protein